MSYNLYQTDQIYGSQWLTPFQDIGDRYNHVLPTKCHENLRKVMKENGITSIVIDGFHVYKDLLVFQFMVSDWLTLTPNFQLPPKPLMISIAFKDNTYEEIEEIISNII